MEKLEYNYEVTSPQKIITALREDSLALAVIITPLGNIKTAGRVIDQFFEKRASFRILYLCDRNDYLNLAEEELSELFIQNEIDVVKIYDRLNQRSDSAKSITFASLQALSKTDTWKSEFTQDYFNLVIVDRVDLAEAKTFAPVVMHFVNLNIPLFGMTTQPDYKSNLFKYATVDIPLEEGIAMGWLSNFDYQIMDDNIQENFEKIVEQEVTNGRKPTIRFLNERIFIKKRDREIADAIKLHTPTTEKTLIFCKSVKHAENFHQLLGTAASRIHYAELNLELKRDNLNIFKNGNVKYLLVVDMIPQLYELPELDVVVFARETDSKRVFYNQLTVGLSKTRKNQNILILDFVMSIERLMSVRAKMERIRVLSENNLSTKNEFEQTGRNFHSGISISESTKVSSNNFSDEKPLQKPKVNGSSRRSVSLMTLEANKFNFIFSKRILKLMEMAEMIRHGYYPTYEQAKAAAFTLGLERKLKDDYHNMYSQDIWLPKFPEKQYPEFTNYYEFLDHPLAPFYRLSKTMQIDQIKQILAKREIDSFDSLVRRGPVVLQNNTFGVFGNGFSLVKIILEQEVKNLNDPRVISDIGEKLGWKVKAETVIV